MSQDSAPMLFKDAEDKTKEAESKFTPITECSYLSKSLGSIGSKELMACDCTEDWDDEKEMNMACGEHSHCINRITSVECTNKSCFCGKDCQNQRFQKKQYCDVKVIQTEKKGYGLVAEQTIAEGSFVYEYIGEVVDEETFRQRMIDYDTRKLRHFYFMMLTKDAFIDATDKGSLARFCNHSCSPNAFVDKWVVGDKLRMGIFAKRQIEEGEEITFDYNVDRYGAQSQPCYCGSSNCLGWMGGKTQTDAALLLPEGISEALGVTRAQEKAWLKRNKQARIASQDPDATINEDFVKSLEVEGLNENDVNKAMAALMKAEDRNIIAKIIDRLFLTEDAKLNSIIVRLHGYKTLSQILKDHSSDEDDLTEKVLSILKRWPSMTRNKIESSQIEDVVKKIVADTSKSEIRDTGSELLADWSKLEMAYRIPKNRSNTGKNDGTAKGSVSPLYGRSGRSASPTWGYDDGTEPTTNESPHSEAEEDDLPPGWQKAIDPNTNTPYYYHSELGVSKWEKPTNAVPKGPSVPKGPKQSKAKQQPAPQGKPKPNGKPMRENDFSSEESKLQKLKEEQFAEVRQREKMLQDLIVQSQREAEEKKKLAEQARQEKLEKIKQRRRKLEMAHAKSKTPPAKETVETLWRKTLARYIPNMIKKHEAEIGHENVKGCARDLVQILASKEAKKDIAPPGELDKAKLKKLKDFSASFMEKFLLKFRNKRPKTEKSEGPKQTA